jgi:hypothetical protein
VEIPYGICDKDGKSELKSMTFEVKAGSVTQAQKDLLNKSAQLALKGCGCDSAIATLPDWWTTRIGADRPQAVVYYREWDGNKFGKYTHSLSIPHYSKPKGYKPNLPQIKKGGYSAVLKLKDNSQIVVNCESITEAKRVINSLRPLVGTFAKGSRVKYGEYGDGSLKKVTTKAVRLDFYSKGQENSTPDWSVNL